MRSLFVSIFIVSCLAWAQAQVPTGNPYLPIKTSASSSAALDLGTPANSTVLNKSSSGTYAFGPVSNAMLSGGIAESKITNLTSDLAGKEPAITGGTTSQFWRGDKTWQTIAAIDPASPPAWGTVAPNTGAFTALTVSSPAGVNTGNVFTVIAGLYGRTSIVVDQNGGVSFPQGMSPVSVNFSSGAFWNGVIFDLRNGGAEVKLIPDAPGELSQRDGANAQESQIYNTFTDASNYERGVIGWRSNVLTIGTEGLGTGGARNINMTGGRVSIGSGILLLTPAAAPISPVEGMIYADSAAHHLYYYDGAAWKQLDN